MLRAQVAVGAVLVTSMLLSAILSPVSGQSLPPTDEVTGTFNGGDLTCGGHPRDCGPEQIASLTACSIMAASGKSWGDRHSGAGRFLLAQSHGPSRTPSWQLPIVAGPVWSNYGAWDYLEESLLLADTKTGSVFLYSHGNTFSRKLHLQHAETGTSLKLNSLQSDDEKILIGAEGSFFVADEALRVFDSYEVIELSGRGGTITTIALWAVAGGELVILGEVRTEGGEQFPAISRVSRLQDGSLQSRVVRFLDRSSRSYSYARLPSRLLATAGDQAYIMLVDGEPAVHRITPAGLERLGLEVPNPYKAFPPVPEAVSDRAAYALVEGSTLTYALYGWEDFLYLLLRKSIDGTSAAHWEVRQIDPETETMGEPVRLPSVSPGLLLVPGEKRWALVEKEAVEGLGRQLVSEVKTVSSSLITGETERSVAEHLSRSKSRVQISENFSQGSSGASSPMNTGGDG